MEEEMLKGRTMKRAITLILFLVLLGLSTLGARVVASETLTIHAYIPQKTTVSFTESGEVFLSSNVPTAQVAVAQAGDATWLTVTAL